MLIPLCVFSKVAKTSLCAPRMVDHKLISCSCAPRRIFLSASNEADTGLITWIERPYASRMGNRLIIHHGGIVIVSYQPFSLHILHFKKKISFTTHNNGLYRSKRKYIKDYNR